MRTRDQRPLILDPSGRLWGLALVVVALTGAISCRCGERHESAPVTTIGQLDLELRAYDGQGRPTELVPDLAGLVRQEISEVRHLEYREERDRSGRLRIRARVSPDGATGDIHVSVEATLDRIEPTELAWRTDLVEPSRGEPPTPERSREALSRALAQAIEALDRQTTVVGLEPADLMTRLDRDAPAATVAAARRLGQLGHRPAVEPLCRLLDHDESPVVEAAREALAQIGDQRAVPCLIEAAGGSERGTEATIDALARIGGTEALDFLEGLAEERSGTHIGRLAAEGAERIRGDDRRRLSEHAGHEHEETAPDALIQALGDSDRDIQIGAAHLAGDMRRADAVDPLCELLSSDDPEVVEAAFDALARIGDDRAIPCLVRWADMNEARLVLVIEALAMIGGPNAVSVLELLARDHESPTIRRRASQAIERARERRRATPPGAPSAP